MVFTRETCGVLGAERAAHPQFAHDPDHDRSDVRAVGPVADVLGDGFFSIVDDGPQGDDRHTCDQYGST